jgi:hypothetical protein
MFFYITEQTSCKDFIESELYLPMSCYSVTKFGRLSVNATTPPVTTGNCVVINKNNVINPDKIQVTRSINNRKFWNEIDYEYDADISGNFNTFSYNLSAQSINNVGITQNLPIQSSGLRTAYNASQKTTQNANYFLNFYQNGAVQITLTVNWQAGSQIETGDWVILEDNGDLQIPNFQTGQRNMGTLPMTVIDRKLDLKSGNTQLTLIAGIVGNPLGGGRYGYISPSSRFISAASAVGAVQLFLTESYPSNDGLYGAFEYTKWQPYIGNTLFLHDQNYTATSTCTLTGISSILGFISVTGLSSIPPTSMIVEIGDYPNSASTAVNYASKNQFAFIDNSTIAATATQSNGVTTFTIPPSATSLFSVGRPIMVQNSYTAWTGTTFPAIIPSFSPEFVVTSIGATSISTTAAPALPELINEKLNIVQLMNFPDGGLPYRIL